MKCVAERITAIIAFIATKAVIFSAVVAANYDDKMDSVIDFYLCDSDDLDVLVTIDAVVNCCFHRNADNLSPDYCVSKVNASVNVAYNSLNIVFNLVDYYEKY